MTWRALVVDDDAEFARAVASGLSPHGWEIDVAATAAEARARLEERDYDVALVDGLLPDGSGRGLIAWMRTRQVRAQPVYLSAYFRDVATVRTLHDELGVQVVLPKPVDLVELRLRLEGMTEAALSQAEGVPGPSEANLGTSPPAFPPGFEAARRAYAPTLRGELDSLALDLERLLEGTGDPPQARVRAHRLHGTAGTYGFGEASRVAGRIETLLDTQDERTDDSEQIRELAEELAQLQRALEADPLDAVGAAPAATQPPEPGEGSDRLQHILLVEADPDRVRPLREAAENRLLRVSHARTEPEALEIARRDPPSCAVVSLDLAGESEPFRLMRRLRLIPGGQALPIALVSEEDSVPLRLAATQAQAELFLQQPISPRGFLELVRRLHLPLGQPAKILLLEDDPGFATAARRCLERRGMSVTVLEDPTRTMEVLEEVQPDLVLLDIVMPLLSGFDVCRLIRSSSRWGELPIIMVTARLGPEVRIASFHAGADDYVAKPIVEAELVARVTQRVHRARRAEASRERDALTDLLLRRPFVERVAARLAAAGRAREPACLALVDLDRFKQVNDQHGHLAGDQVLAVLAQVFRQRLRREDLCARWGGEEFAIFFDRTRVPAARQALERILESFSAMRFPGAEGVTFHAGFSAGIAETAAGRDSLDQLLQEADAQLYAAKDAGRGRVHP